MKTLAFDTCLDKMYVALADGDNILESKIIKTTKEHYHSAFLISTIRDVLKNNNLTPNDIELITTNVGPGSFTGIRACTTVARVFAQASGAKAVGVSSLEILSRITPHPTLSPKGRGSKATLVALDARKEMAYVAIYENKKEILTPQAMSVENLKEKIITDGKFVVISDDKFAPILNGQSYMQSDDNLGEYLIQIALEKVSQGIETDWRKLHPLYIQPPPVAAKKN